MDIKIYETCDKELLLTGFNNDPRSQDEGKIKCKLCTKRRKEEN